EPSAGLDPIVAAGVDMLIRKMQNTFNLTSVVVTHELASVDMIADRACLLKEGRIVAAGTVAELRANPHPFVRQFFERKPEDESARNDDFIRSLMRGE
ncbi:MAG TPA: ABC transporter ATP-binding protein, partial [Candidatus Hydrogenedentes bacterium]|nr:ABC transporter ATP-binding protein [Candidatus Hydrogenedentota bacterium]